MKATQISQSNSTLPHIVASLPYARDRYVHWLLIRSFLNISLSVSTSFRISALCKYTLHTLLPPPSRLGTPCRTVSKKTLISTTQFLLYSLKTKYLHQHVRDHIFLFVRSFPTCCILMLSLDPKNAVLKNATAL